MVQEQKERNLRTIPGESCRCLAAPRHDLALLHDLGMDRHYAQVTLRACPDCGRRWLHYHYELEAFSRSGRWYLGALSPHQANPLHADNARDILAQLDWYFYGGSYYEGRTGRASGPIRPNL